MLFTDCDLVPGDGTYANPQLGPEILSCSTRLFRPPILCGFRKTFFISVWACWGQDKPTAQWSMSRLW